MKTNLLIGFLIFISINSFSQMCQRNVMDCHGACGRFTDNDNDGICDFSPRSDAAIQPADTTAAKLPVSKKKQGHDPIKTDTVKREVSTEVQKPSITNNNKVAPDTLAVEPTEKLPIPASNTEKEKPYPFITILLLTSGLYLITFILVKSGRMKKSVHRKIWNVLLLITFLVSGLLGLLLVVQLNYDILMNQFKPFLTLHVDFGIAMAVISIFHVAWHLPYFKTIFGKIKK